MTTADEPVAADAAFAEFYHRHVKFIYDRCRWAYADDIGDNAVEDLVQNTFWRAFQKADSHAAPEGQNSDEARRSVRAWLFRIAERLFLDDCRHKKRRCKLITGEQERVDSCEARDRALRPLTQDEELARRGLQEVLTDRERDVVETFIRHYAVDRDHQRTPVDELCQRWDLQPENVRQIRKRALKKLEDFITANRREDERVQVHVAAKGH